MHKNIILRGLQNLRGDDYERAKLAFGRMSDQQLDEPHGQSGMSRRELLNRYKAHKDEVESAIAWVESNL